METFLPLTIRTYSCEICDFITSNKKDYQRHILSVKHIRRAKETADGQPLGKIGNFTQPDKPSQPQASRTQCPALGVAGGGGYRCDSCGQVYQSKSGIWKHSKKCNEMSQYGGGGGGGGGGDNALKTMMFDMLKNNQDFQNKVIEMMCVNSATAATAAAAAAHSDITNSNNFNGTNYSHNKTFNLQFFLNEQCKDAMNISDFVSSITLKLSDLNDFGKMGYVEGISKIIIDNLRDTDIYKRPVHCSDAKRETLYVKDDNRWEREGPENEKMMNAVRVVEHKNISLINEWAKNNPKCEDSSTIENTKYLNLSRVVLDGDDQNIAKVIKRVTKEVVIDK
jgi:uncharacterized C2H2 Zn-finger protein